MTKITQYLLSVTGVHPRSERTTQATQDWERGRIGPEDLTDAFRADSDAFADLQSSLDFDYVTDGQFGLAWQDFFRPLVDRVKGMKKGAMVRWFNTNTFYNTPVVGGELETDGQSIWRSIERRFVKPASHYRVILPDPLTLAELSEDRFYGSTEKLMFAYADRVLSKEIRTLEKRGVRYVQFSSPSLVARFRDGPLSDDLFRQLGESIRTATGGTSLRTGFHTFFGDASPYIPAIFDAIPTDDIGFDFTETDPRSLQQSRKGIIAGISDARTTYLEGEAALAEKVTTLSDLTGSKSITLSPSCDLRYVPRVSADEKLRILGKLKRRLVAIS